MKTLQIKLCLAMLAFAGLAGSTITAQPAAEPAPVAPPAAPAARSAAELEKLAEPIALHPDPLIAVILPASVYPLEIVQAARFVKDTNNIPKVDAQNWDENVKACAKFPSLIAKMDADLEWTTQLGQAFLDQPKELMDAIQRLRLKAQQAGTLRNSDQQVIVVTNSIVEKTVDQQVVVVTNTVVQIQPSNPEVIYVPTYPPAVYYPPPGYVYDPYASLITFGAGMAVGAIIANNCDWGHGDVYHGGDININNNVNRNVNRNTARVDTRSSTRTGNTGQKWQPDQNRMRNSGSSATREARGWTSGSGAGAGGARASTQPAGGGRGAGPSAGTADARRSSGAGGGLSPTGADTGRGSRANTTTRPSAGDAGTRPSAGAANSRSSPGSSSRGSAFGGVSSGSSARDSSNRGSASRSGGGASRGGGGFGGGGGSSRGGGGGGRGGGRR